MKLLKRNINTGKVVKIDSYDAFDEISMDNYGMLQDWDINCFDDFVKFFKEDLGDDIHTGEYTYYLDKEEVKVTKEAEKSHDEKRIDAAKKLIEDEQNEIEGVLRYYRKVGGQLKTEGIKVLGYRNHTIAKMEEVLAVFEGK